MGKRNKLRQARRQQAQSNVSAVLAAHSKRNSGPAAAITYCELAPEHRAKIEAWRAFALRPPEAWRCRIKSRSPERRFIDAVRFTFARYPVPAHLEQTWIRDVEDDFVDDPRMLSARGAARRGSAPPRPDFTRWYIIATQGGSLHKQAAHPYMSKLEAHYFLHTSNQLSTQQAFWYATARALSDEHAAHRIAYTKLLDYSVASTFWREAARFFARNPMTIAEMDDLIDFLQVAKQENDGFSLKGRTLAALRRRMQDWHRALQKQQAICGGSWPGSALPDLEYRAGRDDNTAIWRFRQIKTGNDLFHEGQRMHHCVASYKERCISGEVSIWSLACEYPRGHVNKGVTIELRKGGLIMQCRGFANRRPHTNELTMVKRWAQEHGLNCVGLT